MPVVTPVHAIELIFRGKYLNQQVLSVFHYATEDAVEPLADIAAAWLTGVATKIQAISNENMLYDTLTIQSLVGATNFFVDPISVRGSRTGDGLPPFVSWDFTILRAGLGERNGYKRFAGVSESDQIDGTIQGSTATTAAANIVTALETGLNVNTSVYDLVIRRRFIHGVLQTPPLFYDSEFVTYSKIGSQGSRKFGRGA